MDATQIDQNLTQRNVKTTTNESNPQDQDSNNKSHSDTKETKNDDTKNIIISCIVGFFFGFILEKCKVYEPKFIRQQMIFNKFLMMKMFFSALASSMICILILNLVAKEKYMKVFESYRDMLKSKSILIVSAGGLILGLGMTIAGSCPGMMFVQIGAGVNYSYLTLLGGVCAALFHGILNTYLTGSSQPDPITSKTVFELMNKSHFIVRVGFISLLLFGVILMEILVPWNVDYKLLDESRPFFSLTSEVWHPILAGMCLGSLQFFSLFFLSKSLGTSSSFSTFASFVFDTKTLEKYPYLKRFRNGISNLTTIYFVVSVMVGSFISSILGGVFALANNANPFNSFLGGFLLVFGARLAGGCNTGHGISGTSHLFFGSIIAMMSMFVSGILLGIFAYTNDFFF